MTGAASKDRQFTSSELSALAHLYRGEVYRSTTWRTRLDTTTNWAVVTLGIALSITFSSPAASPLPLLLVGVLILFFLYLEARRYLYFNVWRARARWLEKNLFAPLLESGDLRLDEEWQRVLAQDYRHPHHHISLATAIGRRIRRNYLWILLIQTLAYVSKIIVHPEPLSSAKEFLVRADVGPVSGFVILGFGVVYVAAWSGIALWSYRSDSAKHAGSAETDAMG